MAPNAYSPTFLLRSAISRPLGYARPPIQTRWQKGQSGNPKGRPKSRPEILADAAEILTQPISAKTANGKRVRLDGIEAAYLALCKKGLGGQKASLLEAIRIMLEVGLAVEEVKSNEDQLRARVVALAVKLRLPVPDYYRDWAEQTGLSQRHERH